MQLAKNIVSFFFDQKKVFLFSIAIGVLLSLLAIFFTHDIYRDVAGVYALNAREIGNGCFAEGWVGRVPMLNILLAGGLVFLGFEAFCATITISSAFYVLTLFPLRSLLERYLTPLQAAWGCILFVTAPKLIRFSISGLIDSGRYFFLITAVIYFLRLCDDDKKRWKNILFCGLSLAGLSVSRGEGVILAPCIIVALPVLAWLKKRMSIKELRPFFVSTLLTGTVWFAGISPFCAINLHYNKAFATDMRIPHFLSMAPREQNEMPELKTNKKASLPARFSKVINDTSRGGYEPYMILSVLGAFLLLRRKKWNWEYTFFLGIVLLHLLIYLAIGSAYRYGIYMIPLLMPLTMTGVDFLRSRYEHFTHNRIVWLNCVLVCLLCCIIVFQVINGMKCVSDREDVYKKAIAAQIKEWGRPHVPERRLKLAAIGLPEVVFWSEAQAVFGYGKDLYDIRTFQGFDLLFIPADLAPLVANRKDLKKVPFTLPGNSRMKKPYLLYQLTPLQGKHDGLQ